ncbi:serine/threonine-protein kinase, partial [Streptomyces sp. NPDC054784]
MAETTLIQGRYRLLELIGRGGMGEVWRAEDESLGRAVAVKCLKPTGEHGDRSFLPVLRERFRREARVAAGLQHRGVTVVHDFGEHKGVLYLVMELLDGLNLSQLLSANGHHPLPVLQVADIASQVADALAYTHAQGIVHRDLKPANVMRTADGTVKICDFGIARLGQDIGFTSRLTGGGIAMGTPHYMSPEQIAGVAVDHRSDLYSLGCVLYELATGVPPFDSDDAWAVLVSHRDTPPVPPRARRADIPEPLDAAIMSLLAKQPGERPGDAAEIVRRLIGVLRTDQPQESDPPRQEQSFGMPGWTHGIGTGSRATTGGQVRMVPPVGEVAGLTGRWTGPMQPPLVLTPGPPPAAPSGPPAVPAAPPVV